MIGGNEATLKEALPQQIKNKNGLYDYMITYTTELATIGVKENSAYKTSASSSRTATKITELLPGSTYDENATYFVSTMNRIDDHTSIPANEQYIFVKNGQPLKTGDIIVGLDGYLINANTYNAYSNEQKEACKIYRKATPENAGVQKYALSYTEVPNANAYKHYANTENNIIFVQTNSTSVDTKDIYTYKSSNGNAFTTVDPEYKDSFLNAGLNMDEYYQYETSSGVRFVKREDVEGNLNNQSVTVETSAVGTIKVTEQNILTGASIEFDASGRISTITDQEGNTYITTATTETDNEAYDDAYNQYQYNQYVYDQKQNEINASIKILQAQDKSLELRLSNLDTQHSAIQTELEAVKKVMSKNIDNSFKTFNA